MNTLTIVLIVVLAVSIVILAVLYFFGKRTQKRQAEQEAQIEAHKQTVTMLIIDKKKLKLKDSGLPQVVIEQTPKLLRGSKMPIVKAKIGPQVMSMVCDAKIYDSIPVKKEVKATVSGIYITSVKSLRGTPVQADTKKKKKFFARTIDKLQEKTGAKPLK